MEQRQSVVAFADEKGPPFLAGLDRIKQRQGLLILKKPRLFVMEVVVDGPERPEATVVQVAEGLSEADVCSEKVGPAAPVQVIVRVEPLWLIEVIKMSGANAKVVMACQKLSTSCKSPINVESPVARSIVTSSRGRPFSVLRIA